MGAPQPKPSIPVALAAQAATHCTHFIMHTAFCEVKRQKRLNGDSIGPP